MTALQWALTFAVWLLLLLLGSICFVAWRTFSLWFWSGAPLFHAGRLTAMRWRWWRWRP